MKQPVSLGTFAYLATLRAERIVPFLRSAIGSAWLIAALSGSDQSDLEGVLLSFPSGKLLQTYTDSGFRQLGGIAYDPG